MRWLDGIVRRLNRHGFEQALGGGKAREVWRAAVRGVAESDITD